MLNISLRVKQVVLLLGNICQADFVKVIYSYYR